MKDKNKDIVITICLFVLAFALRLSLISKGPFYLDTLELALNAENTLKTGTLHYMHWGGYPMTVLTGAFFIFFLRIFGISDPVFCVNFMSVVLGSLGVGVFFLLSRKILDRVGAFIASLMLCFFPLHVDISTFGLTHPVSIFFNLTGIYVLFLYLDSFKLKRLIASSVFLGLGAAARLTDGLLILVALFLYLSLSFKDSKFSKKVILSRSIIFLFSFGLTVLIFYLPMLFKGGLSQFKDTLETYYYFHSLRILRDSSEWIIDILEASGFCLFVAGLGYFLIEKSRIVLSFLLIWFLGLFIYYGTHSCACPRYLIFSFLPLLIIQAYFLARFRKKKFIFVFVLAVMLVHFFRFYPPVNFRHKNNVHRDFSRFIRANTESNAYIISIDMGPFLEYYSQRKVLYRALGENKKDFDEFFVEVNKRLEGGHPIYILDTEIYGYDPRKIFQTKLFQDYDVEYIGSHLNQYWHFRSMYDYGLIKERLHKIEKKQI